VTPKKIKGENQIYIENLKGIQKKKKVIKCKEEVKLYEEYGYCERKKNRENAV
jgi:hypothetical protein